MAKGYSMGFIPSLNEMNPLQDIENAIEAIKKPKKILVEASIAMAIANIRLSQMPDEELNQLFEDTILEMNKRKELRENANLRTENQN